MAADKGNRLFRRWHGADDRIGCAHVSYGARPDILIRQHQRIDVIDVEANQLSCPAPHRGNRNSYREALAMPSYWTNLAADRAISHDTKTRDEQSLRAWYKSPTWKAIKRHRLVQEPNCRHCAQEGRTVVATHVDHVEPHRGQWQRFAKYENTQSLCARHHNSHRRHDCSSSAMTPH